MVWTTLAAIFCAGCGFESRVEGNWKLDPGTFEAKDVRKAGVPPPLMKSLEDGVFVVEDGVVYVGAAHPDTAIVKYAIGSVKEDCADVTLTASDGRGATESKSIEACLDGDRLELRHDAGKKTIEVSLHRAE